MTKVTYLLGAGASAEDLPLVRSIKDDKDAIIKEGLPDAFRRIGEQIFNEYTKDQKLAKELQDDFVWLAEMSEFNDTVDTFAKYCYLKSRKDLEKIKKLLSLYFNIDQFWNTKFDKRYLVYLTTILKEAAIFPEEIKILSWNYDFQFQRASEIFLNNTPLLAYFPGMTPKRNYAINDYSLVHLNGTTGIIRDKYLQILDKLSVGSFNEFLDNYLNEKDVLGENLTFAWEKSGNLTSYGSLNVAKEIIKDSTILVVIGYSFPFFNREIDEQIFDVLNDKLYKIYYQDKFRSGSFLKSQFNLSDKIIIQDINKVDQFYVPFEL